jgi:oligopeptide transport system permease protein
MSENKFKFVEIDASASEHITAPHYSYWKSVFRTMIQPLFSGYNPLSSPNILDFSLRFNLPNSKNLFGTDNIGNSLFDAVWAGTRTSILISFISTAINMVIGISVGALWGYSKKIDKIMLELYNIIANVPFLLVVTMLLYVIGYGFWKLIFALTITGWFGIAYFIRTQVMIIRDREYNLVSRCLGTSTPRMITRNILPFLTSVIVTLLSREIPIVISLEAFLSFMGIGLTAATPSLGRLISQYTSYINAYPFLFWIPVSVLASLSVSFYIVGQTFADASDPRTHM